MKRNMGGIFTRGVGLGVCFVLILGIPSTWGGSLRLKMTDGTAVEVPYYWEEGGEYKFEVPGGVVGIPKVQVAMVQEVLASKELDPEALGEIAESEAKSGQRRALEALITSKQSGSMPSERLTPEESMQLLRLSRGTGGNTRGKERVHGAFYEVEADFSELVKAPGDTVMIEMRKVVSSRNDLSRQGFSLNLYDGEGNVIQKQSCKVSELNLDKKELKQLGLRGRVFTLMASVRPDEKIKRYEITVEHR